MAEIDIDMIEAIIQKEDEDKRQSKSKSKRERSKEKNRSSSNSKRRKREDSHESESRKRRKHNSSSEEKSEDDFSKKLLRQQEALKRQIEEAKRQAEEAQREDCTVQCIRVHMGATERNIYEFFVKANVGKVRDVRLIKDQKTGKSKGVAYVEFYTPESVLLAMALSGQPLLGLPVIIQASQAEINRQAQATKYRQEQAKKNSRKDDTMKLYIGNIKPAMTDSEVRAIFSPFGEIELIEVPRDPHTGKNKGVAFVTFSKRKDAKVAIESMNDGIFEVREAKESESEYFREAAPDIDLEEKGYVIGSSRDRQALIRELNKSKGETNELLTKPTLLTAVSNCLLINNMFDPAEVVERGDLNFYQEVKDQILDLCEEYGKIDKVWVNNKSQGDVWVKFAKDSIKGAQRTQEVMNNSTFDGRSIKANFVPEAIFNAKVPN